MAAPLLLVVGPISALLRWWRRLRRGQAVTVTWRDHPEAAAASGFAVVDLTVDVPVERERAARTALTETVVRLAESLRQVDDVYHQVVRLPWEDEPRLEPVGPQLQLLGERVDLALGHRPFAGRTLVWLTLPRARGLGEAVDPLVTDPEGEGEPARLVRVAGTRWAAAGSFARGGVVTLYRVLLFVPSDSAPRLESLLERLRARLRQGSS